jgi:hypothetical protein
MMQAESNALKPTRPQEAANLFATEKGPHFSENAVSPAAPRKRAIYNWA